MMKWRIWLLSVWISFETISMIWSGGYKDHAIFQVSFDLQQTQTIRDMIYIRCLTLMNIFHLKLEVIKGSSLVFCRQFSIFSFQFISSKTISMTCYHKHAYNVHAQLIFTLSKFSNNKSHNSNVRSTLPMFEFWISYMGCSFFATLWRVMRFFYRLSALTSKKLIQHLPEFTLSWMRNENS